MISKSFQIFLKNFEFEKLKKFIRKSSHKVSTPIFKMPNEKENVDFYFPVNTISFRVFFSKMKHKLFIQRAMAGKFVSRFTEKANKNAAMRKTGVGIQIEAKIHKIKFPLAVGSGNSRNHNFSRFASYLQFIKSLSLPAVPLPGNVVII